MGRLSIVVWSVLAAIALAHGPGDARAESAPMDVFFGDTHLHTSWSPDAFLYGNRSLDPDMAYRFASGLPAVHPVSGSRVQLERPLDFLVVSDHAEFMGIIAMMVRGDPRIANTDGARNFLAVAEEKGIQTAFGMLFQQVINRTLDPAFSSKEINQSAWGDIIDAAERHNAPGEFSTLIGWEWSAMGTQGSNLHRIVLMREGGDVARQFLPYSSFTSNRPEDLWEWLASTRDRTGASFIAIPHNSNLSNGEMFELVDSDGDPMDESYARERAAWEPIAEITQVKGDSETHRELSPTDEFAGYEVFKASMDAAEPGSIAPKPGSFIRSALRRGLEVEGRTGTNPYRFGLIGSTDSHTGLSTADEDNFQQKWAIDAGPRAVLDSASGLQMKAIDMGAAGLAAVWAESNTREHLFDAMRRREVYATTGTRIRVRVFGGWRFNWLDARADDFAKPGYKKGVPMGGDLGPADGKAPSFLIRALKDPVGANLDRIQVVKGWLDADGASHERVYDVALSDDRELMPNGKASPVGNTVDLASGRYTNDIGDTVLAAHWRDPDFDATQSAFYYVRVLEIPTPRYSLFDALALDRPHPDDQPPTIQERAYTSPIWYRPER